MSGYKKKNSMTRHQGRLACVTNLYPPIWVIRFCVLYDQTIIFTGKMVFISDRQRML